VQHEARQSKETPLNMRDLQRSVTTDRTLVFSRSTVRARSSAGCIDTGLPAGRRYFGQSDKPLVETANVHHARWVMFTETRCRASGVVRSLPSSTTSPLCVSMRHRGRSSCRRDPIRLSPLVALCYHPWWADPPSYWAVRARILLADPKGTAHLGGRPSHPIFRERRQGEVRRISLPRIRVNKPVALSPG
jgi:hypothetical protein